MTQTWNWLPFALEIYGPLCVQLWNLGGIPWHPVLTRDWRVRNRKWWVEYPPETAFNLSRTESILSTTKKLTQEMRPTAHVARFGKCREWSERSNKPGIATKQQELLLGARFNNRFSPELVNKPSSVQKHLQNWIPKLSMELFFRGQEGPLPPFLIRKFLILEAPWFSGERG